METAMIGGHDVLHPITQPVFAPPVLAEELLQRPWCNTCFQGYGLDTLLRQIGELPTHVDPQMGARVPSTETISKPVEEGREFYFQPTNFVGVHALPSTNPCEGCTLAFRDGRSNVELAL
jgi:hypothetical protein